MENVKLQKSRNFWFGTAMLLAGVVIGYLVAPMKNGINFKQICGNSYGSNKDFFGEEDCVAEENYVENSD